MTNPNIASGARQPYSLLPLLRQPGRKLSNLYRRPVFGDVTLAHETMAPRIEERRRFARYVRECDEKGDTQIADL